MHMAKNNISFWAALISNLSLFSPLRHYCLAHSGKRVAWHNFWSLTWTRGKGRGCRCWLDVSFTLGDKLLCERAILDFQGHGRHLRDCQWSTFIALFTLTTTNRRVMLRMHRKMTLSIILSNTNAQSITQRRRKSGIKLDVLIKLNTYHQINAS